METVLGLASGFVKGKPLKTRTFPLLRRKHVPQVLGRHGSGDIMPHINIVNWFFLNERARSHDVSAEHFDILLVIDFVVGKFQQGRIMVERALVLLSLYPLLQSHAFSIRRLAGSIAIAAFGILAQFLLIHDVTAHFGLIEAETSGSQVDISRIAFKLLLGSIFGRSNRFNSTGVDFLIFQRCFVARGLSPEVLFELRRIEVTIILLRRNTVR